MYRSRSHLRSSPHSGGSIVAFLLIACFGLLFVTGCSSAVRGPDVAEQSDTFTAEDAERLREATLEPIASDESTSAQGQQISEQGGTQSAVARLGEGEVLPGADADLIAQYDAIRSEAAGQGGNTYRVVNEFLNVRGIPSVSGEFLLRLNQGAVVQVTEFINASWAKVSLPGGKDGYVSSRYIAKLVSEEKLKDEQKSFEGIYFVNYGFVNVRKSADTGSEKLGEIPGDAFVRPLSVEKEWARIAFEGKEGYVSMQFLAKFQPAFLVRQDQYQLTILHYDASQDGTATAIAQHVGALKNAGAKLLTFRDLHSTVMTQEVRDVRLSPKSVIVAISGVTAENAKQLSDAVTTAGGKGVLFLETQNLGLSGISEKMLLTLQANGMDIESAGHTGDDLRTLTEPQTRLELNQSRKLIEDTGHQSVYAVLYPQGGVSDRVLDAARQAGYLFGIGAAPDSSFTRSQFLRLPSYTVSSSMTVEDVVKLVK